MKRRPENVQSIEEINNLEVTKVQILKAKITKGNTR